jgi:hypothetical protein
LKWKISISRKRETLVSKHDCVKRQTSRLDVIWRECIWQRPTHYGWEVNCHSLPVWLSNHASEMLCTIFIKDINKWTRVRVSVCECCEMGKTMTPLYFPCDGQILLEKDVTDDCPAEAI